MASILATIFIAIVTLVAGFVYYCKKKLDFWKNRGVTAVSYIDQLKFIEYNVFKPMATYEMDMYKKYGRIYGGYFGFDPHINVVDPEIVKQILVKDFHLFASRRPFESGDEIFDGILSLVPGDERWKRIRSVLSPTFSSGKMRKMSELISDCAKGLQENLEKISQSGESLDVKRYFGTFAMDVIATCAFATKIESSHDPENAFAKQASKLFDPKSFTKVDLMKFMVQIFFPSLAKILNISFGDAFKRSTMFFKEITLKIIKERSKSTERHADFLQLVMDAMKNNEANDDSEEEADHYGVGEENHKNIFAITGKQKTLSENELVSQCVMFFVVGYETTGTLMSCCAYELAMNPEIQDRLCEDVDKVFEENEYVNFDVVYNMEYLDHVISETLRLHPPAMRLERTASVDYKLGDTGITLPKGCVVGIPLVPMHRDPEYYPDPDTFDPNRFSPEEKAKRNPYMYLPFGAGPRNCIAMRFALMEAKLGIVHALRKHKFVRHKDTIVPMQYVPGGGLISPKDLRLGVVTRN